jgi:predicted amidohydrolase
LLAPAEYPATRKHTGADGWKSIEETYESPEGAATARLELVYRWDADGEVFFAPAALERVPRPEPRLVGLAAVRYRPRHDRTVQENLNEFAALIAEAAAQGADIICLPEGITLAGTGKSYVDVSEPLPGPTSEFLGRVASRHGVYIVAGILEREGDAVYNTAVLIGRTGALEGSYRKVSLPREEIDGGVTPGDSFPTFDTDFGRIGVMICWDVAFPEPARQLALGGAEVILMPIWGGNTTLARARAIENQVYLVSSSYDMETGIFGLEGELIAEAEKEGSVAVVEVDLNAKMSWPWIGDFKNRIPREIPPKTAIR